MRKATWFASSVVAISLVPAQSWAQTKPEASAEGSVTITSPLGDDTAPAAGSGPSDFPTPPPSPPSLFASDEAPSWKDKDELPLAGWHGRFFLRDRDDYFQLFPFVRVQLDSQHWFGPRVHDLPADEGGDAFASNFLVRRAWLGFDGNVLKRWSYRLRIELERGQVIANRRGGAEMTAAPAGVDPTAATAQYASVQSAPAAAYINDAWLNYSLCPCLNFQLGQFLAPFTQSNQTTQIDLPTLERNVAIRGFVVPFVREIGLAVWGDIDDKLLYYRAAIVAGDGNNRPGVDGNADVLGRVVARPLKGVRSLRESLLNEASVGVSARHGERDPERVGYDVATLTTSQGYTLFSPSYRDSRGRRIHAIPSGSENVLGGELRLPFFGFDVRSEAYFVSRQTREAVDGFQLTNTERLGTLKGVGWYVNASYWLFGDRYITGDPAYRGPSKINLRKKIEQPRGFQLAGEFAHVKASYNGGDRGGDLDENTPGAPNGPGEDIEILQFGGAVSYWHTKHVRLMVNYTAYLTPGSGTSDNLATVPANLGTQPTDDHLMHELATRLQLDL